jgi:L-ascorbate metabolism protein UlaG (beta-lactamase superfamily)
VRDSGALPRLVFLGHSTMLVELDGVRVLTDPVLGSRVSGVLRRAGEPIEPHTHANVDLVVISHLHADHLHLPSLRRLGRDIPIVVPDGAAAFLRRKGFRHVIELAAGRRHEHGPVRVTATKADHDGFRQPFGPRASAVGYVLEAADHKVYFAGDTDLFPEMDDLGGRHLDVALVPVWGWGPNLGPGHLDPARAAEATRRLRPKFAVPIHWGTLHPYGIGRWMRDQLVDPPHTYAKVAADLGLPTRILLTQPGAEVAE